MNKVVADMYDFQCGMDKIRDHLEQSCKPLTNADRIRTMSNEELARERITTFASMEDDLSPWVFITSSGKRFKSNHIKTNADEVFEEAVADELKWLNALSK